MCGHSTQQCARADSGAFRSPRGRRTRGRTGVKLAALLMAKECCTAKPRESCSLDHRPRRERHFHLLQICPPTPCTCRGICSPGSALRTLLRADGFAFLFNCLSRAWWVSGTSSLGSPCPAFALVELKLGVEYFPLPLSGKRPPVTSSWSGKRG